MKMKIAAICMAWLTFSAAAADQSDIASVLRPYVERHELAGAVTLVVSKDQFLSLEAVGYSDISAERSMQTNSIFWIASISKPITAAALMMLVDEGKVRLDDPVQKYLPQFMPRIMAVTADQAAVRVQKPQHLITVRNLLSHTSGMPFSSAIETPTLDVFPLATRVQSYSLELLRFEPGSDHQYSNAGVNTAGRIIEVVSGMRYEEFLQSRLFEPLGMADTTFWLSQAQLARLAKSYKPNASLNDLEETLVTQLSYPLTDRLNRHPMPAGGLFSTASDLGRFCQMLLNGGMLAGRRYLHETAIQEMTRNHLDGASQRGAVEMMRAQRGYGLGWETYPSGVFGHGGAYATYLRIDPKNGLATVWLVQHAGFPGDGAKSLAAFEAAAARQFMSTTDIRSRSSVIDAKTHD